MLRSTVLINPQYAGDADLRTLVNRLPEAFAAGEGELLYNKRNRIRRFALPSGLVVIVKDYHHPNLFQRICYSTFWRNKAQKSYLFGLRLLSLGIDTPQPIAAITYRKWFGLVSSYYFVSTEDRRPDLKPLREDRLPHPEAVIPALAAYLIELHQKGFLHGDANLSNFLFDQQANGTYRFAVIDTNRSRFLSRPATRTESLANLMRLTHVRKTLCEVTAEYARQRGWDVTQSQHTVLAMIEQRERRKAFWMRFK